MYAVDEQHTYTSTSTEFIKFKQGCVCLTRNVGTFTSCH